jgi:hypothetical protein
MRPRELCRAPTDVLRRIRGGARFPTWFVVAPGHGDAELERVVSGGEAHEVVEKRGAGALAAVRLDPRRRRRLDHLHGADAA